MENETQIASDKAPDVRSVTKAEPRNNPAPELNRLMELAVQYREIGPPLVELANKIGQHEFAERVIRMGLEGDTPGLEFYFVAALIARRERNVEKALRLSLDAVRTFAAASEDALKDDDAVRMLHLVRTGFSILLFDEKDISGHPFFVEELAAVLPTLEARLGNDAFYRSLMAQVLWFSDKEKSEAEWEKAATLDQPETTWNARGTWYKDAEKDFEKAEHSYRKGLESSTTSPLLFHNLAQVLLTKVAETEMEVGAAKKTLREVDELLRAALREDGPKGLRRHIHSTRDRLNQLRSGMAPQKRTVEHKEKGPAPEAGATVKGRVQSLTDYGAFISLDSGHIGLLHKSELTHSVVEDPGKEIQVGEEMELKVLNVEREGGKGRLRISLSRRALVPAPKSAAPAKRPPQQRDRQPQNRNRGDNRDRDFRPVQQRDRGHRSQSPQDKEKAQKIASLGEMLLAKMQEQSES